MHKVTISKQCPLWKRWSLDLNLSRHDTEDENRAATVNRIPDF